MLGCINEIATVMIHSYVPERGSVNPEVSLAAPSLQAILMIDDTRCKSWLIGVATGSD